MDAITDMVREDDPELLSVDLVVERLSAFGISKQTVYRWCRERKLESFMLGRRRMIPKEAFRAFLMEHYCAA